MISVDDFQLQAAEWLADNRVHAPHDYGPICPPDLIDDGLAWQHRIRDAGYAGIHWPVEYGGRGLTVEHNSIWMLECARAGVPPFLNMVGFVLAGGAIQRFGTPEQQEQHLQATLDTDHVWCQLFSEPGAGSDLGSLTTRAELDGDHYLLNGQKVWCSGGRYSNWGILMARTRPLDPTGADGAPKHEGISFFLCPMDLPGIEVRPLKQMTGEAEFDEVFFTDVALPADHLLGPLHGGWGVGMAVLTSERGHIGTSVISIERRLASMTKLGDQRELNPIERQKLASLVSRGSAFKAMAQRQGPIASTAASLMKLGITDMTFDAAMLRGDIAGADAMILGSDADGMLGAPGGRIAGGTSQVQRNIIGERLLGLPREPKPSEAENRPSEARPSEARRTRDGVMRVPSSGHVKVVVHEFGGSGAPLLLSHATGFHGYCYLPIADALDDRFTSYALDFHGHGDTPRPNGGGDDWQVDWDGYGDDALAAGRAIAPDGGLTAFGHSMGGAALLMAAHRDPDLFDTIIIFEPIVFPPDGTGPDGDGLGEPPSLVAGARRRRPTFDSFDAALANFASKPPMMNFDPDVLRLYVAHGFRPSPEGVRLKCDPEHEARTFENGGLHRTWDLLPEITTRVVVVTGVLDGQGPAAIAEGIAQRLPNSTFLSRPDFNHFGPFVDPAGFARLIADSAG